MLFWCFFFLFYSYTQMLLIYYILLLVHFFELAVFPKKFEKGGSFSDHRRNKRLFE